MKRRLIFPLAAVLAFAACDRNQQARQLAEERAALEREKAELAQQKLAAQQAAVEQESARLEAERAALEAEKAKLSSNREAQAAAEKNAAMAAERERRLAAETKAAQEAAARQAAELREREARMTAEQARAAAEQAEANARAAAEDARAAQTVDFFYDALDPLGDWVQTDRYGYAFRPALSRDPHWRPYTDGSWVFTDYGWTWRSEEPFGWATYHYGRWARVPRFGWVWVPGSEWGPAWVSWRRGDEYVGWAPLPPDAWSSRGFNASVESYYDIGPGLYVFVRAMDFGERSYRDRCIAPERNVTIINQTVNVTKVTYQNVQNQMTVVNNGPDFALLERTSRTPIQRATVQRVNSGRPVPTSLVGEVLQLAAPVIRAAEPVTKPKVVKGELKAVEMDRGWQGPKQEEQRFREEAKKAALRAEEEERTAVVPSPRPAIPPRPVVAKPVVPQAPVATPLPVRKAEPPTAPPRPLATPVVLPAAEVEPAKLPPSRRPNAAPLTAPPALETAKPEAPEKPERLVATPPPRVLATPPPLAPRSLPPRPSRNPAANLPEEAPAAATPPELKRPKLPTRTLEPAAPIERTPLRPLEPGTQPRVLNPPPKPAAEPARPAPAPPVLKRFEPGATPEPRN